MESENQIMQKDELELLESIYIDNLKIINSDPYHSFNITISPDNTTTPIIKVVFFVEFHSDYPSDKIFNYKVYDDNNKAISSQFNELNNKISIFYEENKGFPVVYQIAELVKDYTNELDHTMQYQFNKKEDTSISINSSSTNPMTDTSKKLQGLNLLENRKYTKVTKDSYSEWFSKFIKDKEKEGGAEFKKRKEILSRQTGREYFLKNKALLPEEDLQEGEDVDYKQEIKVDEDLFQNDEIDYEDIEFEDDGEEEDEDLDEYEEDEDFIEEEEEEEEEKPKNKSKSKKSDKKK